MNRSTAILPIAVLLIALAAALASVAATNANKNGCPNGNSANGASHANEASAHGAEKQGDRDCGSTPALATPTTAATAEPTPPPTPEPTPSATPEPTPEPTPTPAPSPTPLPSLDVEVVSLNINGAVSGFLGIPFQITGQAIVRNNGPTLTAIVDTTFTPSLPAGCTATTGAVTVQNTLIPSGGSTFLSRSWMVTCTETGLKTFGMSATAALDPTMPAIDTIPANNTRTASRDIQVN